MTATVDEEREVGSAQHLELETAGWQRRFEADANRAAELVDLYCEMGYEVALYTRRSEDGAGWPMT